MDNTLSTFKFIHCSDLHIDSPFKGVSEVDPALGERLRASTLKSFHNIVDLAIQKKVDAVIIAGDVFDGADKSLKAQFKFCRELERLSEKGIPSFIAHGNHDPLDTWSASLKWPSNATIFSGEHVQGFPISKGGREVARIYGISFPCREVFENLALKFQKQPHSGFAIAVLHANVGGNTEHDQYAPCSVDDLVGINMDYWALGHVHTRQILRDNDPVIVYPGNSQARNIKETGAKGCCLVTLQETASPSVQFFPTDVLRFYTERLDLTSCSSLNEVMDLIRSRGQQLSSEADGCDILVRLTLVGQTPVHDELQMTKNFEALQDEMREYFKEHQPLIGVDLILNTRGTLDIDSLRQGKGFVADIINLYDQTENNELLLQETRVALKPLFESWVGRKGLESISDAELKEILLKARGKTIGQLISPEG
jgi:DNA repair exonuclease SbcCD nuclease subunit